MPLFARSNGFSPKVHPKGRSGMPVGEALSPKGTVRAANPWGTKRSTVRSVAHQISELLEFDLARKRGEAGRHARSEFGIRGSQDSKSELLLSRIPNSL